MATFTASTTAQLVKFVSSAASGDTILLKAGTYGNVNISGIAKAGNVTIASADATHPAVLTDLSVKNSSGLTFSGLELFGSKDMPFQVYGSSRIVLDKLDVHGTLNGSSNDDYRGMLVRESNGVTVSNSHFHELTDALSHINSKNVLFTGNTFDTIRDNGISGGGSSQITVSNNSFTNFDHVGSVHPDVIQFWTTNTTTSASDITVTGNVFTRGSGSAVQGIWITDEVGSLRYNNVTVTNNVMIGAMYNGVVVSGATTAKVAGNVVIAMDDQASWLGVRNVDAATVTDNQATGFALSSSGVKSSGNVQVTEMATPSAATISAQASASASSLAAVPLKLDAASATTYAGVNLIGFVDGASTTGRSYKFTEVRMDGTAGADRLSAGAVGSSHLYGLDGADALVGSKNGVTSTLEGGKGDDTYTIYQAKDVIVERLSEGNDTVYTSINYTLGANLENLRALQGGLALHGNEGANNLVAHADGSVLYGEAGDDFLQGGIGNDRLFGGAGNDRITGGGGNDYMEGGTGDDVLTGGDGRDTLIGGDGNDSIEGGGGSDAMTGGKGADTFVFRGGDLDGGNEIITDFKSSESDRISLSAIDANRNTAASDRFSFIGGQAFHGTAGELRFALDGDGITVYGDTNGDRIADLSIHLTGVTTITSSAFFL